MAVDDADTRQLLEVRIDLIEMNRRRPRIVPEARLSFTRVCRQHFVQLDPQLFIPGPIWQSVSFTPGRDVTDSEIYLFVAVLFFSGQESAGWRASGLEGAECCMGREIRLGLGGATIRTPHRIRVAGQPSGASVALRGTTRTRLPLATVSSASCRPS